MPYLSPSSIIVASAYWHVHGRAIRLESHRSEQHSQQLMRNIEEKLYCTLYIVDIIQTDRLALTSANTPLGKNKTLKLRRRIAYGSPQSKALPTRTFDSHGLLRRSCRGMREAAPRRRGRPGPARALLPLLQVHPHPHHGHHLRRVVPRRLTQLRPTQPFAPVLRADGSCDHPHPTRVHQGILCGFQR